MPIVTGDILFKLSVTTGAAGNSTTQGNVNNSLGKYISTTQITDATLNNLFDDVSGDENTAGTVDYRAFFIHNNHASLTLQSPVVWLSGKRCTVAASTDKFTFTAHGFSDGDAVRIVAEYATDTLPTGVNNSTTYFVVSSTANDFKLSATSGGSAIDITVDGTATVRRFGNTTVAIAIDNTAASAIGSASAQADLIGAETTAPSSVGAFSSPVTKATGLALGNLPNGQCRAVWVKRTPLNNGARNPDSAVIRVEGDTAA
jgi:hypothetical protein